MFSHKHVLETQLDRCIDALLADKDWRALADEVGEDILSLMTVAEWLYHTARQLPHDSRPVRKRVWLRLQAQLDTEAHSMPPPHGLAPALGFAGAV